MYCRAVQADRRRASHTCLRQFDEPALGIRHIRVQTDFASPKHGTELVSYRNEPAANRPDDAALGAVIPRAGAQGFATFPRPLGNMAVGTVTKVGSAVACFAIGDRLFGHFPIRETHTVDQTHADLMPDGLPSEVAVSLDRAIMALAMRDAEITLGNHVAIFGTGAIGLIAVQRARLAGADRVIAIHPIA